MNEYKLKYGCNPHQGAARVYREGELPFEVLNGRPGYINLLDALNAWQLVREARAALSLPAAASFKHVSPAGAAIAGHISPEEAAALALDGALVPDLSPAASAYARARGADRLSSFGDFIAVSDTVDESMARLIQHEVSDGIIAPAFERRALEILKAKKKGGYTVLQIDPAYEPEPVERREVFGVAFEQERDTIVLGPELPGKAVTRESFIPKGAKNDLILALIALKYTQSNSVCFAFNGQTVGIGAGQQSRVHCTRLAADKADIWQLRRHPKVLSLPFLDSAGRPARDNAIDAYIAGRDAEVSAEGVWQTLFKKRLEPLTQAEKAEYLAAVSGVSMASDAFFPFADSVERAAQSGVKYIVQPGGSVRDDLVIAAADACGMVMVNGAPRLFHH